VGIFRPGLIPVLAMSSVGPLFGEALPKVPIRDVRVTDQSGVVAFGAATPKEDLPLQPVPTLE
jgi:hypothetical protein